MPSLKERLVELLIKNKLLTLPQLNQAIEAQKEKGGRLSDILVSLNFIKESDLNLVLSETLSLPLIDLRRFKIDYEIVKIVSREAALRYHIVPISKIGDTVTVAIADPLNIFALDQTQAFTGYKINPIIASSEDIVKTIDLAYPDTAIDDVIEDLTRDAKTSSLELIKEEKDALPEEQELERFSREAPVIKITNTILEEAVKKKASDILITPLDKKLRIRFRIDGVLQEQAAPPKKLHPSLVSRIKVVSELNIAEHRLPQDGYFKARVSRKEVDFRVSVLPSSFGEKVAIRILDKSSGILDVEKLGFSEGIISQLKKLSRLPHGMILVCGPTGCGKTTTLYSILKSVDSPEKNLVTVEDPIEYQLEGVNQVNVKPDIGLSFASALRSILRQDPNVIMIGEIRDFETVDIAIKSALTGHLVLSTLHTTTAPGAVVRLMNMGVEPYLITSALICVMAQRLVRKLCPYCKEEYTIKKEVLESLKLNLSDTGKARFSHGKGCPRCFNTGYSGRLGIAEILVLTPSIRELILALAQEHVLKQQALKEGMQTLRQEGLRSVFKAETSIEEVLRVTAADD